MVIEVYVSDDDDATDEELLIMVRETDPDVIAIKRVAVARDPLEALLLDCDIS